MQIAQVMAGLLSGLCRHPAPRHGQEEARRDGQAAGGVLEGCENNGIDAELAGNIFDLVEKFAGYGFNKSHSAAYALLSYQTAWLKVPSSRRPLWHRCMSADMDNTDKVVGAN